MSPVLESTARALLRRVAVEQAESRLPSLAAAVVRDGRIAWFGARGRVGEALPGEATQYRIGSITKSMVAVVVMRLRDEGRLDLLDPIGKHVPGTPVDEVTVAQLLSHTGGLTAEPPGQWWERTPGMPFEELLALLGPETSRHRPGRRYHYSNLGFGLLGELVARHRGVDWAQAVRREVLAPLGMDDTTTRPRAPHAAGYAVHPWADVLLPEPEHDAVAMAPAGQIWSTPADLARWAAFVAGDTGGVLAGATLAEMREPAIVDDGDAWTGGYGLGLQLARAGGRRLAGHTGSMPGFLATVWADPADRTGVLFMANATSGVSRTLLTDLLAILDQHEPRLPAEWAPAEPDPDLMELAGPWYWGPAAYALRLPGGRELSLVPLGGPGRASRFTARDDGTWTGLDGYYAGETLRVVRRPDGSLSHLDLNTFVFTRTPYDPAAGVPGGVDPDGWRS
ncbi:serine hydrolase domain-containing protein [Planomonospora venezuelensis]|uniref:CubicO group peptidase (Beta-lactamase class C family) n=1 Tax=Planomonospora venezuelensis TaxID=1999 RepID=A0A841DGP5_PLAVE|nr:serine hydrolase domain-containing protein [Planomonospora venezuelensis]MBB5967893.1 CubicO group peptidase (beta-lactamase class C family) [Planomonospora venezuelensis]GIN05536.1 serine hydrolase [Planomonospora venezuelensis]